MRSTVWRDFGPDADADDGGHRIAPMPAVPSVRYFVSESTYSWFSLIHCSTTGA